jgi:hypothetical protein
MGLLEGLRLSRIVKANEGTKRKSHIEIDVI